MLIEMLTRAAGPTISHQPGDVVDKPAELAEAWIKAGIAVAAKPPQSPAVAPESPPVGCEHADDGVEFTSAAVDDEPPRRSKPYIETMLEGEEDGSGKPAEEAPGPPASDPAPDDEPPTAVDAEPQETPARKPAAKPTVTRRSKPYRNGSGKPA